jgi:hypothetical protein
MRYLLLSVLVVCVIGVMVPSAFAETYRIYVAEGALSTGGCYKTELCLFPYVLYVEKGDSILFVSESSHYNFQKASESGDPQRDTLFACSMRLDQPDGYCNETKQMNEVGEFSYYGNSWLKGKVIVTEPGEYNIAEKYFAATFEYELIQELDEGLDTFWDLERKFWCYQSYTVEESAISICTEVLAELKDLAGNSWNESFESVFNPEIIWSEKRVASDVALPIVKKMSNNLYGYYFIKLETMVTNAENTVQSTSGISLGDQADIIYDLRKWKDVKVNDLERWYVENNRFDYSLVQVYTDFDKMDAEKIQDELAEEEKEKIKQEIKQEISGVVESESVQQTSGGCGAGTVLVNGVCQLAPTQSKTTSMSIEPLYIIIGVVAIGGIIGAIAVAKRGSKTPKPTAKPKPVKQKPAKKKETSTSCENCGNTLNPKAKFCGGCGTARS